jgi:hypothetical protein
MSAKDSPQEGRNGLVNFPQCRGERAKERAKLIKVWPKLTKLDSDSIRRSSVVTSTWTRAAMASAVSCARSSGLAHNAPTSLVANRSAAASACLRPRSDR